MEMETTLNKIERAHRMYRELKHRDALELYTEALGMAKNKAQKIALHSNRAACYLKLHDFNKAAQECTSVLDLDQQHTGALMLRAQTLVTLKDYQSALFDVNRLMELNPASDVYRNLQARLRTQLTVPSCQNLYKNSFTYHCLPDDKNLQFDDANQFLEQCEKDKARVLVHCMSGKNRSPAIVIAYLMRSRGWRFPQSFQWVKDHRQQVELTPVVREQLIEFEKKLFGSNETVASSASEMPVYSSPLGFNLGFPKTTGTVPIPIFNQATTTSIFQRIDTNSAPSAFVFGAGRTPEQRIMESNAFSAVPPTGSETPMDSS